jgi:hypothetical protein
MLGKRATNARTQCSILVETEGTLELQSEKIKREKEQVVICSSILETEGTLKLTSEKVKREKTRTPLILSSILFETQDAQPENNKD